MPRLKAFELDQYDLRIFTNDHNPPHFHLSDYGETFELRIYFMDVSPGVLAADVVYPRTANVVSLLRGAKRAELIELVLQHQDELLAEWSRFHPS
jgi:hypothetical protein